MPLFTTKTKLDQKPANIASEDHQLLITGAAVENYVKPPPSFITKTKLNRKPANVDSEDQGLKNTACNEAIHNELNLLPNSGRCCVKLWKVITIFLCYDQI